MRLAGFLLSLWLVGCGGGDEAADPLVGIWGVGLDDGCVMGIAFDSKGRYSERFACSADGQEIRVEAIEGLYEVDGERLVFTPTRSSCDEATALERGIDGSIRYSVDASDLVIHFADAVVTYSRLGDEGEEDEDGTVLRFGCWAGGTFEARGISDF